MRLMAKFIILSAASVFLAWQAAYAAGPSSSEQSAVSAAGQQEITEAGKSFSRPAVVYVTDFYLDPASITKQGIMQREGPIKNRLKRLSDDEDPAEKAVKLVSALSDSIAKGLNSAGQKAERMPNPDGLRNEFMPKNANLPKEGGLVAGWFSKVDEGNRVISSTVGFGKGDDSVEIDVVVYDLSKGGKEPFLHFGSDSGTSIAPGGIVTKNPYSMAAKFALSKGATLKDVQKQGEAIAKKLIECMK